MNLDSAGVFPVREHSLSVSSYDLIYLSPHFDDVVLSCSGGLCCNKNRGLHPLVVTVFAGNPQHTLSTLAREYHERWKVQDDDPYAKRRREDQQAMILLGADYLWIDYPEVLYRDTQMTDRRQIFDSSIPFTQDPAFADVGALLHQLGHAYPQARFVVPLGIGSHRDHIVVNEAARATIDASRLVFYEDFPYVFWESHLPEDLAKRDGLEPEIVDIVDFMPLRIRATEMYRSQIKNLFGSTERCREMIESYVSALAGDQGFAERYWCHRAAEAHNGCAPRT